MGGALSVCNNELYYKRCNKKGRLKKQHREWEMENSIRNVEMILKGRHKRRESTETSISNDWRMIRSRTNLSSERRILA